MVSCHHGMIIHSHTCVKQAVNGQKVTFKDRSLFNKDQFTIEMNIGDDKIFTFGDRCLFNTDHYENYRKEKKMSSVGMLVNVKSVCVNRCECVTHFCNPPSSCNLETCRL